MSGDSKETLFLKVDPENPDTAMLDKAGLVLRQGGTVAFPTETVYGLGANALDESAVRQIYKAKGRPSDNPLIVHVATWEEAENLACNIPNIAKELTRTFWPGPLTIILPRNKVIPDVITGGLETVAIRMPEHPVALGLIRASGVPIAAPSANLSGKPSPTSAKHVWADLQGRIDVLIDGGDTRVGVESTVLDLTTKVPMILRPGGITREQLEMVVGLVEMDPALESNDDFIPKAPGMKYTHYAPEAEMFLVNGEQEAIVRKILEIASSVNARDKKVGIMATSENLPYYNGYEVVSVGSRYNLREVASNIYKALRKFDELEVDLIVAESLPEEGVGAAIMNRLLKAAGHKVIKAE